MGNERRELVVEERREIERILTRLSSEAGTHETEIIGNIDLIARIDLALAKARYAREVNASEPIIVAAGRNAEVEGDGPPGVLRLIDARHPLLGKKAVPLSVEIGRDFSILVITGPNTGGKTVTLKTIGLLSLMIQAGLPITASAESRIPLFDDVFADIGDEQSIEQTLSTFSWHIGNIVRIINGATKKSLVLLDELGTNTDPGEGSALARSILLHFLSKRIMTAATTHYTELKAFAHVTDGLQNASLDVNPATMIPTYHLMMGIPGSSNALATASRLGLSPDIITAARDMISQNILELEDLLTYLARQQKNIESLCHSLEKERNEAEQRNTELAGRLRQLEEERRQVIQETRDQVVREAADLQREVRQAASELRKEKSKERIERARKTLSEVREQLNTGVWQAKAVPETDEEAAEASPIAIGDTVWLREVGLQAKVLSVYAGTGLVEVLAGSAKMTVSLDSVEKRMLSTDATVPEVVQRTRGLSKRMASLELDLRGKRAEEVELALDSYLDEASLANLGQVRIIHGIGTGTVRQIVRDFVASHPLVSSFRPGGRGEGGNGVTVVRL
jgi:DNA mismatch repair protein MutS2